MNRVVYVFFLLFIILFCVFYMSASLRNSEYETREPSSAFDSLRIFNRIIRNGDKHRPFAISSNFTNWFVYCIVTCTQTNRPHWHVSMAWRCSFDEIVNIEKWLKCFRKYHCVYTTHHAHTYYHLHNGTSSNVPRERISVSLLILNVVYGNGTAAVAFGKCVGNNEKKKSREKLRDYGRRQQSTERERGGGGPWRRVGENTKILNWKIILDKQKKIDNNFVCVVGPPEDDATEEVKEDEVRKNVSVISISLSYRSHTHTQTSHK